VTALVAAIFVKRQLEWLRGERSLSILIGTGAALFRHELRGLPGLASTWRSDLGNPGMATLRRRARRRSGFPRRG
jgi:hypothetical protein